MASFGQIIASVGQQRGGKSGLSAPAVASKGYAPYMNQQMRAVMQSYKAIIDGFENVLPEIIAEALEPTLKLAKKYCPKDTHALVNSGYIDKRSGAKGVNVVIGFARGGVPDYGIIVHERVDLYHKPPTRSKFLTAAMNEDQANVYKRILVRCKF